MSASAGAAIRTPAIVTAVNAASDERALSVRPPSRARADSTSDPACRGRTAAPAAQVRAAGRRGAAAAASFVGCRRPEPAPSANAAPSPATAPIASAAPAGQEQELVGVAGGDGGQRLEVLVAEHVAPGAMPVSADGARRSCWSASASPSARSARACFSPSARSTLRLLVGLGVQDRGLPQALGAQDGRLLLALGLEHGRPLGPVGPHLLLHRLLDRARRVDALELDAGDAHAPLLGCLVEHDAQLRVDLSRGWSASPPASSTPTTLRSVVIGELLHRQRGRSRPRRSP